MQVLHAHIGQIACKANRCHNEDLNIERCSSKKPSITLVTMVQRIRWRALRTMRSLSPLSFFFSFLPASPSAAGSPPGAFAAALSTASQRCRIAWLMPTSVTAPSFLCAPGFKGF